jgi:hypothetical protein
MEFLPGDETDRDYCIGLEHEFFRCEDAFREFETMARLQIAGGADRWVACKAFDAYARFLHHFYEFMLGAYGRERMQTGLTQKRNSHIATDAYINHHARRVIQNKREAILNGTAPAWENALSAYPEEIDPTFAAALRKIRNEATGHIGINRPKVDLTAFYRDHHMVVYWLYRDCVHQWGRKPGEFPDWQQITDFSVMVAASPAIQLNN